MTEDGEVLTLPEAIISGQYVPTQTLRSKTARIAELELALGVVRIVLTKADSSYAIRDTARELALEIVNKVVPE